ncbi:hypothetical protein [Gramella sp. MAR_2010_147]|uniref:hypothetical protein n=1 Tax=Gramella sp. MAR_2010_147 TaxID=1250205 RepID=UPI0008793C19|nr:hypothetical protein [Gramella sp. MAR_2010_147]SDS55396.1 hypothetical protein SAMN04488553_2523 [Gramella sp. MAR_2010_147]
MKKILASILIFGCVITTSAQEINDYKYVSIPETYEFAGATDEYRLNSLTKFLFEKNGYNTLMNTEKIPADLDSNPCLGLQTKVVDNSGLFVTRLVIKLLDCKGQVVFESKEGRSREKDFQEAFQEALRDAFTSLEEIEYNYVDTDIANENSIMKIENKAQVDKKKVLPATEAEEAMEVVEVEEEKEKDEIEEIAVEEVGSKVDKAKENSKIYLYSGKEYHLKETNRGIGLFQENSLDPIAILIETNGGKSYIYNSLTNQGVAYFNTDGNLVVEYFSRQEDKKVSITYELKN